MTDRKVSKAERDRRDKESRAKVRQMFDREITHFRMGDWRGTKGSEVTYLGTPRELHGSVCTDCPNSPNYKESA